MEITMPPDGPMLWCMQIENRSVQVVRPGDDEGVKIVEYAREHDKVFRVTPD